MKVSVQDLVVFIFFVYETQQFRSSQHPCTCVASLSEAVLYRTGPSSKKPAYANAPNNKTYLQVVTPSVITTLGRSVELATTPPGANAFFNYSLPANSSCGFDSFVYRINDTRWPYSEANATAYVTILGGGEWCHNTGGKVTQPDLCGSVQLFYRPCLVTHLLHT